MIDNDTESGVLEGRNVPGCENSEALLAAHKAVMGGNVRTRFPPEPNGYLHIGHAKSMNMNFSLAFEKLGVPKGQRQTMFRYDDTNPEAESKEYIDALRRDVEWLGWAPHETTFSSNYFHKLHEFAVQLIKDGKAYVCHQTKAEVEASRNICRARLGDPNAPGDPNSPWRNRSVDENLKEFEKMRKGMYDANAATLRMKIDMTHTNPNMWDFVAYRIRYMAHPHAGDEWCIYPTYDYTHCIVDALEDIDYSICTLEFENRRESYFWLLEALGIYRPKVYEMSRLNMTYTVLSKRKLLKLVNTNFLRGWDDPRMPTIRGLRRRGYTPAIINAFCTDIGVTRNENLIDYDRLAHIARLQLHETAPRVMGILDPIKVTLTCDDAVKCEIKPPTVVTVPDFPFDTSRGTHDVSFGVEIFIDRNDFRTEDDPNFYGLAPGKIVGLKYACHIKCDTVETDSNGKVTSLKCSIVSDPNVPAKGMLHWVPQETAVNLEVRWYDHLFTVEQPDDNWEAQLNRSSEIVYANAVVDPSLLKYKGIAEWHCQFERVGFFVIDEDTTEDRVVLNLTVALRDSRPKAVANKGKSRKEEQARQLAEKLARMSIRPEDMFTNQIDMYSKFDENGVPSHNASGEPLTKSAIKKLKKEWDKQKKLFEGNKK